MKVIIAGSRGFDDYPLLVRKMDRLLIATARPITIVSGMALGADRLGERYAVERGYRQIQMPARWYTHGRSAGFIRNVAMAACADTLVAFWDGESRGTSHMIGEMKRLNKPFRVIHYVPPALRPARVRQPDFDDGRYK